MYLKMYPYYRLVRFDADGKLLTDSELESILIAENYVFNKVKPITYGQPAPKKEDYPDNFQAFMDAYKLWQDTYYWPEQQRYADDFSKRATTLQKKFMLGRMVVDYKNPDGTNHFTWATDVDMGNYGFMQCAQKLNTLRTANTIHFICFDRFG